MRGGVAERARPAPRPAGLHEVYPWDFGQRDADLPCWRRLLDAEALALGRPLRVVEVGSGDGRVPRGLARGGWACERWLGVDSSSEMVRLALEAGMPPWCYCVVGDAAEEATWAAVREALKSPADALVWAYSGLFLLPHDRQETALRLAAGSVRLGGVLAVEVFRAAYLDSGLAETEHRLVSAPPGRGPGPWLRTSRYGVDAARRATRIERDYGPADGAAELRVQEEVFWRLPAEMPLLAERAGLAEPRLLRPPDCAPGHLVMVARA